MSLPKFVINALSSERKAQLTTIAAVVVHVYVETQNQRGAAGLGAELCAAAPWRSEKTWQNYVSGARALLKHAATLTRVEAAHAVNPRAPTEMTASVASFLGAELEAHGYTTSIVDVTRFAQGKVSFASHQRAVDAAEAQAEKDRQAKAAEVARTEAARAAPAPVDTAKPVKPAPAPEPKAEPAPATPVAADAPTVGHYEGTARPVTILEVVREADGNLTMVDGGPTRVELETLIANLQAWLAMPEMAESVAA